MGARPETLKKLADTWGTDEDYWELMQLAGHPLPKSPEFWGTKPDFDRFFDEMGDGSHIVSITTSHTSVSAEEPKPFSLVRVTRGKNTTNWSIVPMSEDQKKAAAERLVQQADPTSRKILNALHDLAPDERADVWQYIQFVVSRRSTKSSDAHSASSETDSD